jgi:hypothetical protein
MVAWYHMAIRAGSLLVLFTGFLAGCASSQGLHPDRLQAILQQEESRFVGTPSSAGNPTTPNAPALGLYLKPTGFLHREFEWTRRDRETVLAWSKGLQLASEGRSAGFVPLTSLKGDTLTELRTSAARHGVNWLLIFDGAAAVDRYNNYKAALLYWTILGAYFADGTHSDALCLMTASLWDVKTGVRLFEQQAEGMTKKVGPAALVDDGEEIERARTVAMETLLQRLTDQFSASAGTRR